MRRSAIDAGTLEGAAFFFLRPLAEGSAVPVLEAANVRLISRFEMWLPAVAGTGTGTGKELAVMLGRGGMAELKPTDES